jgi:uncharacterized membrane protein YgcG
MTEPREDLPHTIDAIVAALQSPARAEELEGEEALVGAMASAVAAIDHEEPASMTLRSRPLKFGLIAGVAVLSVAGVAAAATGALPERRPDRPVATTVLETTSTSPQVTAVAVTAVDPTAVDPTAVVSPSTSPTEVATTTPAEPPGTADVVQGQGALPAIAPPCPADVVNHGQYVSGVAHDTPPGPGHGEIVSAAAQSDCGKDGEVTEGDEPAAVGPEAERGDTDPTKPGKGGSNGNGGEGQSRGQGQGQGQGQGSGASNGSGNGNGNGAGAGNGAGNGNGAGSGGAVPTPPRPRGRNG